MTEDTLFNGTDEGGGKVEIEDRPRGLLSQTDREFLHGLKDYSHKQTELNRRQSIRERIFHGLLDFNDLWYLKDEDRKKILADFDPQNLNLTFSSLISFVYIGVDQDTEVMESILERGILRGANFDQSGRSAGPANDVNVSVDVEYGPDTDELSQRLREGGGDQLTPAEIGALVRAGKLDPDDLSALENAEEVSPNPHFEDSNSEDEHDDSTIEA